MISDETAYRRYLNGEEQAADLLGCMREPRRSGAKCARDGAAV